MTCDVGAQGPVLTLLSQDKRELISGRGDG